MKFPTHLNRDWNILGPPMLWLQVLLLGACASPDARAGVMDARCRVDVYSEHSLGDEREGTVSFPSAIFRTEQGQTLIVGMAEPTTVLLFDAAGNYQGRIGREGAGPTEFAMVSDIFDWRGDSIAFWDSGNSRVQIYSSELSPARTLLVNVPSREAISFPDGSFLFNASIRTPDRAGLTLHYADSTASILVSFDGSNSFRAGQAALSRRSIAASMLGGIWSGPQTEYRLRRWSATGVLMADIQREVPWFPGGDRYGYDSRYPNQPPAPGLIDIFEDDGGYIWTIVHLADPNWKEGLGPRQSVYGEVVGMTDAQKFWDTVIEVIDPTTGAVIASRRIDVAMRGWLGRGVAYSYLESTAGEPTVTTWRTSLMCDD